MGTNAIAVEESIFDRPVHVPDDYIERARAKGWPEGLVERCVRLRVPTYDIEYWLDHEREGQVHNITKVLDAKERSISGTLRVREACWSDAESVADLYANAPEDIGEWEVTVERSPYPFAQFRLQEHPNIQIVEDRGIVLACAAHSSRNTIIGGRRLTAHIATAWRVRKESRGQGMTNLLRTIGGPACAWFGLANYYYVRSGNFDAVNWIKALRPDIADASKSAQDIPGQPVTVHHFKARAFDGEATGIRKGRRSDARRCAALINRTHRGLDLFRPYSADYLKERLEDCGWGPKPDFITRVYGWDDYYLLEEDGQVIACAGLWDRGRDVREVWRHKTTGETTVIEPTALMDFGFAEGREDAMERLIAYLLGVTQERGRHELLAPIERLPELVERLAKFDPGEETRTMAAEGFHEADLDVDVVVRRPYTDLAYW
jgi:hypothetical protein